MGGAHKKGLASKGKVHCKVCETELIKDINWKKWAYSKGNLICFRCKNKINLKNYYKKRERKLKELRGNKI